MTVQLTSPVLGKAVGDSYTGDLEPWLLAQGYAKRVGYTGPGVANTGPTDVLPAQDPTLPENREDKAYWPETPERFVGLANDADNLNKTSFPASRFDFDEAGDDNDAPAHVELSPATGSAVGGTVVTLTGQSLVGVTAVNFGATPGTALDVSKAADGEVKVTSPAGTAGAVDVTLVDADGNTVVEDGFTYTA